MTTSEKYVTAAYLVVLAVVLLYVVLYSFKLSRLEREAFMDLIKTQGTLQRIEHMLDTGKPLRN